MTEMQMIDVESKREALETAACASRERAYARYSHFRVGAAVLAASGNIYTGVNIENAAYGLTICAERVAIFKAVEAGERRLLAIAVCTENGATPCGPCRQVMREFANDMPVYIRSAEGQGWETSLRALLPHSFGPEHLPAEELS
jgi:cytidine deaminase